ncbi:hypothetical protein [Acidisphaera sp. L21]|uniref:hypothetical protein n=1 Tax=Acidisphaera sp. L21 TaxID=1641851 RepID=UPI00131BB8B5|nr:hypothetical protein [Acidisphaera sp. L21]
MIRLVLAALLLTSAARAADRPPTTPQRDVDITYTMAQRQEGAPALTQRMRWSVSAGRLRVDPPTGGIYMIIDYRAKRMSVVKVADHAVLDVSTAGPGLPGAESGSFTRRDTDQIAGLPCTDWQTADAGGQETLICMTEDGVMLRASQGGKVLVQASSVSYTTQNPADFTPPDGFRHVSGDRP